MLPAAILNEQLKRALPKIGRHTVPRIQQMTCAPYLTYDSTGTDDGGFVMDEAVTATLKDEFGMMRTPFPVFRFACVTTKRTMFGCCERRSGELALLIFVRENDGRLGPVIWAITYRGQIEGMSYDGRMYDSKTLADVTTAIEESDATKDIMEKVHAAKNGTASMAEIHAAIREGARVIKKKELAVSVMRSQINVLDGLDSLTKKSLPNGGIPEVHDTFLALYGTVLVLCYNYLAPHAFMAKVTPAKQGKSVEWLKAREHYTVIHRHHAANNSAVREGAVVSDRGNIQRLAHSRRAHTKLLKHPRYTFKRGQRIFVRASWVGPKEWKDTAGQTYQILTPAA